MIALFLIVIVIMFCLILFTTLRTVKLNGASYFKDAKYDEDQNPGVGFCIKKHTIFRFFALFYQIAHSVLQVISVTASSITLYTVMASDVSIYTQIFFVLISTISTNMIIGFRFDKLAECYGTAMRILENAILKYLSGDDTSISFAN